MFRCFFPDEYLESAYAVNYEKLYQEGVRGLLFDIDNTLVPHGAPADKRAVELFERLRKIGFKSCFLSNNQIQRVASFNEKIGSVLLKTHINRQYAIIRKPWNCWEQTVPTPFYRGSAFYRYLWSKKSGNP